MASEVLKGLLFKMIAEREFRAVLLSNPEEALNAENVALEPDELKALKALRHIDLANVSDEEFRKRLAEMSNYSIISI